MKPQQKPLEIRGEEDQLQTLATYHPIRVASRGPILLKSVSVEKYQSAFVAPHGIGMPPTAINREFDYGTGVSATRDDDIEMHMTAMFITKPLQPPRKGAFTRTLRRDEDSITLWNEPAPRHGSAERGQPAKGTAAVEFSKIAAPAHPLHIAHTIGPRGASLVLLDDEHLFLFEIVEGR